MGWPTYFVDGRNGLPYTNYLLELVACVHAFSSSFSKGFLGVVLSCFSSNAVTDFPLARENQQNVLKLHAHFHLYIANRILFKMMVFISFLLFFRLFNIYVRSLLNSKIHTCCKDLATVVPDLEPAEILYVENSEIGYDVSSMA
ncbi:uncharacterized protein LOC131243154 isoform X1 [Magnolia sinica]|uniref:uncharacterized protein LOC131243154 isoform X1 n=1 Tax=Magnolia sinica TaxID=86752 RepID=UPI0026598C9A|nr:uncharacterized protein LOC131243154 isoform X1 [Magnolia sinica]